MIARIFREFTIQVSLCFVFGFLLLGAIGGYLLYYERLLIGSTLIGSSLLLAGLLWFLI